jgi:hypothetical protein
LGRRGLAPAGLSLDRRTVVEVIHLAVVPAAAGFDSAGWFSGNLPIRR